MIQTITSSAVILRRTETYPAPQQKADAQTGTVFEPYRPEPAIDEYRPTDEIF